MRSFLHHRIYVQGATENVLFFGCRKRDMDYHYREEWEQLEREGRLKVFAACSRDQVESSTTLSRCPSPCLQTIPCAHTTPLFPSSLPGGQSLCTASH